MATLEEGSLAMCGGNQDFVWDLDPRGVVLMSPTPGGGFTEDTSIKLLGIRFAKRMLKKATSMERSVEHERD